MGGAVGGASWSSRSRDSFRASETLSRLASFIARSDAKQPAAGAQPSHLPLFGCRDCGKGFPYQEDLLQHREQKTPLPKPHRCPRCGRSFSLRSSLQLHLCAAADSQPAPPRLLDSSPYACAPCGRSFSQKQALLQHQQAGCSESPPPSSGLPDESPPVSEGDSAHSDCSDTAVSVCQLCSRMFCTGAALRRHFQESHQEAPERTAEANGEQKERLRSRQKLLSCRSCDLLFRSTSSLYLHRKEKHRRDQLPLAEPHPLTRRTRRAGVYPCESCSKVFSHHLSFKAHCREHAAEGAASPGGDAAGDPAPDSEPLPPDRTPPAGADPAEDRDFPCPSCPQVFSVQQQLREHMELHQSSSRRRHCSVCACEMEACRGPGSRRQRLYHCVPCQRGFSALAAFLEHCQEHLRVRVEEERLADGRKA